MRQRLKRAVSCLALCALLATCLTVPAAAADFADVPANHWAAASIRRCVELGFFQGESATRFGTGHEMTRGAFAVVLCRFFGWETAAPEKAVFPDVPADAWYAGAVEAACEHGAITRQNDAFRPGDPITREELAVMLVRALDYGTIAGLAQELPMPFRDVKTNSGYIAVAYRLGLVSGTSDTAFSPDKTAPREQVAVMLMRLYDKLHRPAPGRVGIVFDGEDAADLAGYEAVAVDACKLVYTGKAQLTNAMPPEELTAVRAAAEAAGTKQLLYVTGSANPLKSPAAETAGVLAAAVKDGGWDGLFLDIPELKTGSHKAKLTQLVSALRSQLGDQLLYVMAEAPAWQGKLYTGYDYAALGAAADRLVLRVAPYGETVNDFPMAPVDPLEEVYYTLEQMRGSKVDAGKLSLLLTTTGSAWSGKSRAGSVTAEEIAAMLAEPETTEHYSGRYACAYLQGGGKKDHVVMWYLDGRGAAERVRLADFFGVDQVCLSDTGAVSQEILAALK